MLYGMLSIIYGKLCFPCRGEQQRWRLSGANMELAAWAVYCGRMLLAKSRGR